MGDRARPTPVTNSIDRAKSIPQLRAAVEQVPEEAREKSLARLMSLAGDGVSLVGEQSAAGIEARIREFRG